RALLSYGGFGREGFQVLGAFDVDPAKVGTTIRGVRVFHTDELEERIRLLGVEILILTLLPDAVQSVVDRAVRCGITAILNFVPVRLVVPSYVKVHYVDLTIEIESLAYYLK
ncbi:hypothetical protein AMJ85_05995, partial [candidate division BRC1 bacterium SM23_51]